LVKRQTKNALRVHVGLAVAEAICLSAFALELSRALSGNTLSWAYVFEWPILGVYAVFMWRRLLHADVESPIGPSSAEEENRLNVYNDYLAQIHGSSQEPPGRGDEIR